MTRTHRIAAVCGIALAAISLTSAARAQSAPIQYWIPGGPFGFGGETTTQFWGSAPDEDGFRKGFSFTGYSSPVNSLASGMAWGGLGARAFMTGAGLSADGASYAYSFKGLGDTPVTFFGGASSLRTTPDVFTSIVTPGFERSTTLATSVNAGVEFRPTANTSLSFSAGVTQPSATTDTDLRTQLLSAQQPGFFGRR